MRENDRLVFQLHEQTEGMSNDEDLTDAQRKVWCLLVELMVLEGQENLLTVLSDFDIFREEYLSRKRKNRNEPS